MNPKANSYIPGYASSPGIPFPIPEQVEATLKSMGIKGPVPSVPSLTQKQLIEVFRQIWSSQPYHMFVKHYDLNQGNFSSFMKGKRNYPDASVAIQDYLLCGHQTNYLENFEVIGTPSLIPFIRSTLVVTTVIMIDGDNSPFVLETLKSLELTPETMIIFYLRKDSSSSYLKLTLPYFYYVRYSEGSDSQAVDIKMAMDATLLSVEPLTIVLISHDKFTGEVVKGLTKLGAKAHAIDPKARRVDVALRIIIEGFEKVTNPYELSEKLGCSLEDAISEILASAKDKKMFIREFLTNEENKALFPIFKSEGPNIKKFCEGYGLNVGQFGAMMKGQLEVSEEVRDALIKFANGLVE